MHILAINVGSSSLKFALFEYGSAALVNVCKGSFKDIEHNVSQFTYTFKDVKREEQVRAGGVGGRLEYLINWLQQKGTTICEYVVHRIVHGGSTLHLPQVIDESVLRVLENCVPMAPEHLPPSIAAIKAMQRLAANAIQIACFDTDFHWQLPQAARTLPLPASISGGEIRRYGFHGISYQYVYAKLAKQYSDIEDKKIVIAHLGSGSSMAAIQEGKCVDTTMSFTPTGGLVMGTRTGDLDPGILLYLLQHKNFTAEELNRVVNDESGLKGISGLSSDMKTLLEQEDANAAAKLAVEVFCYQATKHLGALIAAMGGIDILVFTGGIGASSPVIRARICQGMRYAGVVLNEQLNEQNAALISATEGKAVAHTIQTNEEWQMAANAMELITKKL
jgi:acetate kinase